MREKSGVRRVCYERDARQKTKAEYVVIEENFDQYTYYITLYLTNIILQLKYTSALKPAILSSGTWKMCR